MTLGGREIQILDNYNNPTYADGYVGAIYNQWPPLANPSRPPGEWQTLDIAYFAARYDGDRLIRNAYVTIFMNGVMIQDNVRSCRRHAALAADGPQRRQLLRRVRARTSRRRRPRRPAAAPRFHQGRINRSG